MNRWIAALSEARGIPVNVVDDREASRFIVPALIDRDPVLVAISTAGTSPVLARRLRERLEALIPTRLGELSLWLQALRRTARSRLRDSGARRRDFRTDRGWRGCAALRCGRRTWCADSGAAIDGAVRSVAAESGEVTLVGAGPGDPELLTLKALRALQDADVILHDRLVAPGVLDMARRDARRICVGEGRRQGRQHAGGNQWTADRTRGAGPARGAAEGRRPVYFRPGRRRTRSTEAAQIRFSVIPGVTAAAGCAAYAGIPLTHRDHAHSVTLVTGHQDGDGREPDYRALAKPGITAVFYMGLARVEHIAAQFVRHGAPKTLPAALIAQGTLENQRVVTGTLATHCGSCRACSLESPTLLVVGEVVRSHDSLTWFNPMPQREVSQSA